MPKLFRQSITQDFAMITIAHSEHQNPFNKAMICRYRLHHCIEGTRRIQTDSARRN